MALYTQEARGIRKVSPLYTLLAADTGEILYQRTTGGQNPRTVIVRKLMIYNNTGADAVVQIGTGLAGAFAAIMPSFFALDTFDNQWIEDDIAEIEVDDDLTVQSTVLGVLVQIEVEEIGS